MDKEKNVELEVLREIQQLIDDRIGSSIAPPAPEEPAVDEMEEASATSNPPIGDADELSPEESEELAKMYDEEGILGDEDEEEPA